MNHLAANNPRTATRRAAALIGMASLGIASCTVGPDYKPVPIDMPVAYKSSPTDLTSQPLLAPDWWTLFGDPDLAALEAQALQANTDLQAAAARVVEARSAARSVESQFYPVVTLNPSVTRARAPGGRSGSLGRASASTTTTTLVPFDLSYEVDIWGRVRRTVEASNAQARASAADFGVVLRTLTADVAQNYFTIRSLDSQDKILTDNISLFRQQVSLTQTQQRAGIVGQTDVLQAQTQLDATDAQAIDIRRQRADVEHALAILTGRAPSELTVAIRPLDLNPPTIPPGLPADLLRRRADVAEAEQNLITANASVGVATANFYPAFHLIGSAGFESTEFSHTLDWANRIWAIAPSVSIPIFEGGKLRADLEQAKARYDEIQAAYRGTVLGAIRDVEDALTDLHMRADAGAAQARAVAFSREYLRLAQLQYRQGLVGYLQVIDAERTLLNNELAAVQILSARLSSTALFIKALGGGWTPATAENDPRTDHAVGPPK